MINRIKKGTLLFLTILGFGGQLSANNNTIVATAKMDSVAILMGHQTTIKLSLSQGKDQQVTPLLGDTLVSGVELLRKSPYDTTALENNRIQIDQELLITSFDSGFYFIPPFKYIIDDDTFATNSLSLKVIPLDVDTTKAGFDIKGIKSPKFVLTDYLPNAKITLSIVLLLIAIAVGYYLWRRRKQPTVEPIDPRSLIPPHVRALQSLEAVKGEKLWQNGREKEYYTRITDTLRAYIEERFQVTAMELTSAEILALLYKNREAKEVYHRLREVLQMADLVKFAKLQPLPDENEQSMRHAILFIEETIPQAVEEAEQPTEESKNNDTPTQN